MDRFIEGIKCTIIREIYSSNNYRTFACLLDNPKDENQITLNKYGNFTISGDLSYLKNGESYTLDLKQVNHPRYGIQYMVERVKDYEIVKDLDELNVEQSKEILTKFTTETQANTLLKEYPNFISMVINGKTDEIDVKKLKNIKEYRLNCYIREINTRFKYYYILIHHKNYDLTIGECQELDNVYGSVEAVEEAIDKEPYSVLIDILHREFLRTDKLLMKIRPELKETSNRIEHIALHILSLNEEDDNTYMDANTMAGFCAEIDKDCIQYIKKICIDSQKIWYDDDTKRIAKADTYIAESTIADYFTDILCNQDEVWDFNWKNYTKIKDGILTDEQSELLHMICKNRIVILNAGAGRGKTSAMMALVNMLEDNGKTYSMFAPTGRAAKRLAEQTHRKASTVHKGCSQAQADGGIDSDVIICDEWSMYGLEHMMMLIKACSNPNVRFVFSGDIHQLPSIALGCIMRDFIESGIIPIITLTITFRYKEGGLSAIVDDIYNKLPIHEKLNFENGIKCVLGTNKDYTFIKSNGTTEQILDVYMEKINQGIKPIDIAVITPWNVKDFGTYKINNLIQSAINPARKNEKVVERNVKECTITFRKGDIVMNTQNNYHVPTYESYKNILEQTGEVDLSLAQETVGVFNGDIGKILEIDANNVLIIQFDENMVVFQESDCNSLVLGYAGTIHKYQGSQCPHIILLTMKCHERSFNNNLLYTGISRASKETIQIGDLSTVENCISIDGNENRQTQLKDFIIMDYELKSKREKIIRQREEN
ncbi:MAG: helix-hairpin-helix containing domain protein [Bacteriophage sp.]|nr:MAG: helix-hairpin-helix containing domain protein [Bacteriophage sp.]